MDRIALRKSQLNIVVGKELNAGVAVKSHYVDLFPEDVYYTAAQSIRRRKMRSLVDLPYREALLFKNGGVRST